MSLFLVNEGEQRPTPTYLRFSISLCYVRKHCMHRGWDFPEQLSD